MGDAVDPGVIKITKKQPAEFGKDSDYTLICSVKPDSKKNILFHRACQRLTREIRKLDRSLVCGKISLKKGKTKILFRRNRFDVTDGPTELRYEGKVSKL